MTRDEALTLATATNRRYWDDVETCRKQWERREPVDQHGSMPDYIAALILEVERRTAKRCAEIAAEREAKCEYDQPAAAARLIEKAIRHEFNLEPSQ